MPDEHHLVQRLNFSNVIPGHILLAIVIDIAGPYMAYQFIYPRLPLLETLLLISLLPLGNLLNSVIREHEFDVIAVPALLWLATLIGNSYLNLDPIMLLLIQLALPIGLSALFILISQRTKVPAFFSIDHAFHTRDGRKTDSRDWHENLIYRQTMLTMNRVWGWSLIILVGLLILISRLLNNQFTGIILIGFTICTLLALTVWSISYRDSREQMWQISAKDLFS